MVNVGPINKEDMKSLILMEEWVSEMEKVNPSKDLMNQLVMNFLILEGYEDAAIKFQKESGIKGKEREIFNENCS